jgi:hypothetical protein
MIPGVVLPAKYSIQEMNLLIQGVCGVCHD